MEPIKEILARQQKNSLSFSPENSEPTHRKPGEISIYNDRRAEPNDIMMSAVAIKRAFPALTQGFYDILVERVLANGFTAQRLQDAATFVIDNCPYPTPTIANFISYDRTCRFYTYQEMVDMSSPYGAEVWDSYQVIRLPHLPKPVWIHKNDISKYQIRSEK